MMEQKESLKEELVNPLHMHLKTETKESCLMEEEALTSIRGILCLIGLTESLRYFFFQGGREKAHFRGGKQRKRNYCNRKTTVPADKLGTST